MSERLLVETIKKQSEDIAHLRLEVARLRSENNKLATAHPELTRNDHRTFGDLMLKLAETNAVLEELRKFRGEK